jgi:hypothetical protein
MQDLIRPKDSNEKHKECSEARIKRDSKDVHIIIDYLLDRNPFSSEKELRSISSGVVANEKKQMLIMQNNWGVKLSRTWKDKECKSLYLERRTRLS